MIKPKKKEILLFLKTWMDFEGIILTDIVRLKDKYHVILIVSGI